MLPSLSVLEGEELIASIYDTRRGEDTFWRQCLFVLLYDEHGGFYAHVPPPAAVVPDAVSAAAQPFRFDRLGIRVPAILVSPWVGAGVADHTPYDQASLPATIKTMFGLPNFLTARDAAAATFDHNFLAEPRSVALMNLSARLPSAPAAPCLPAGERSLHQRSPLVLAEVIESPAGGRSVDTPARDFLERAQCP